MKKQTAVSAYEKELVELLRKHNPTTYLTFKIEMDAITEKAKAMEREQIIDAYYGGTAQFDNAAPIVKPKTPQDYFTQTYEE